MTLAFRRQPPSLDFQEFYLKKLENSHTQADALKLTLEEANRLIFEIVEEQGLPLVIKNLHHHPDWNTEIENGSSLINLFSFNFLDYNYGDKGNSYHFSVEISLRDNNTRMDHSGHKLSSYFSYLTSNKSKKGSNLFYGKDLSCPVEWKDHLFQLLPSSIAMKTSDDLLRYLPVEIQPECLMLYIGSHGTSTPFHVDVCGSLGHNILVAKENAKAHALWTIIPSKHRNEACKYWGGIEYPSPKDFSVTIQPSKIGYLNAIELDGLLIVDDEEFKNAPFSVYRFSQDIGDLVIIPPDSPHQVQNKDGPTIKMAWNRITPISLNSYLFNIQRSYTRAICYHSVVSLTSFLEGLWLCQSFSDKKLFSVPAPIVSNIATLCRLLNSFKMLIFDEHIQQIDFEGAPNPFKRGNSLHLPKSIEVKSKDKYNAENFRQNPSSIKLYVQLVDLEEELPHTRICDICKSDLLNRFFHCSECIVIADLTSDHENSKDSSKFKPRLDGIDICFECYARGRYCRHPIMTLMQTLESMSDLEVIAIRANRCIKNWASKISNKGIQGSLPSTSRDRSAIFTFMEDKDNSEHATSKTPIGTLAFGLLLERVNALFTNNDKFVCKICSRSSLSDGFVKCSSCGSDICHRCIWNINGNDPFEYLKDLEFKCNSCIPQTLTSGDLIVKKIDAVLPWIGCISLENLYTSDAEKSFITPCFFDMIIYETTKKISISSKSTEVVKKILQSFFEKCSETKYILELQHRIAKRKIFKKQEYDFEACLSSNIDVGLGIAVKNREFKKKSKRLPDLADGTLEKRILSKLTDNNSEEYVKSSRTSVPAAGSIRLCGSQSHKQ